MYWVGKLHYTLEWGGVAPSLSNYHLNIFRKRIYLVSDQSPDVLIVEDDVILAQAYSEIIEGHGLTSELVPDGHTAVQRLAQIVPGMVILDLHLPGLSGVDVLQYMRQQAHLKHTMVIVLTANAHLNDEIAGLVDRYFLKPIDFDDFNILIEAFASRD
ncbi:MAG: hypothetical protein CUN54_07590 [Phototrophicales bacterium]|nr:MAG: hypothetical protein CUN54_07590 [Phototrophicales bacterium]